MTGTSGHPVGDGEGSVRQVPADKIRRQYDLNVLGLLDTTKAVLPHFRGDEPEVVYRAATDGTDRLRYTAGPYAAELLANRAAADDTTFIGGVKQQFGS
ncbi:hypothetical protein ACIA5G_33075 [Amycolatopsis sp. NPDC051758]|uniref:hypothetical protein n=1 Tax=Amycolatopsis sp. NPDC051758 TaxID=3363935 RepID=UPI0037984D2A